MHSSGFRDIHWVVQPSPQSSFRTFHHPWPWAVTPWISFLLLLLLQMWWLKTVDLYSLAVLEARSLKSVSLNQDQGISRATASSETIGKKLVHASFSFWWCQHPAASDCITQVFKVSIFCKSTILQFLKRENNKQLILLVGNGRRGVGVENSLLFLEHLP